MELSRIKQSEALCLQKRWVSFLKPNYRMPWDIPRPLFLEGRAKTISIGRASVPACHYDVNRGRLTYHRGLRREHSRTIGTT